jgi:hypothetical protein
MSARTGSPAPPPLVQVSAEATTQRKAVGEDLNALLDDGTGWL